MASQIGSNKSKIPNKTATKATCNILSTIENLGNFVKMTPMFHNLPTLVTDEQQKAKGKKNSHQHWTKV